MIQLWFYIEGNKDVSLISISPDLTIHELKKQIYAEENIQSIVDCGPTNLTLTKVNEDIDVVSDKIRAGLYQLDANQRQLRGHDKIFKEWPEPPPADHLHFVVTLPGGVGTSYRVGAGELPSERPTLGQTTGDRVGAGYEQRIPPLPPSNTCPRRNLVSVLYEKLKTHNFILVRGTPASGKSMLARYLAHHIYQQEPSTIIIFIPVWSSEAVVGGWQRYLRVKYGWVPGQRTIFIFDDAQTSYQDTDLWIQFFKELPRHNTDFAIAFASYGSPTSRLDIEGIPFIVTDSQRVTLRHTNHDGLGIVGLLFSELEFNELVDKKFPTPLGYSFDPLLLKDIFQLSGGHVGAIHELLEAIVEQLTPGKPYTWDLFMTKFNPRELLKRLEDSGVFRRGLPPDEELQKPPVASVLSKVLIAGSMVKPPASTEETRALDKCYRNGWLHADRFNVASGSEKAVEVTVFAFPSGLHRWFVEWKLFGIDAAPLELNSILELAIKVIRGFCPTSLSTERRIGPGCVQRPPEAQYQDEFYRSFNAYSEGQLITFPEFGTTKGWVEFYIPSMQWGVELVRDGDRLKQHSSRFSPSGSYGTTLELSDHIILDFRKMRPQHPHADIPNLYHVVFSDDYQEVVILDHLLQTVPGGEFRLLKTM